MCDLIKYFKTLFLFSAGMLSCKITPAQCAPSGPNTATVSVNNTAVGSIGWFNMTGVSLSDNAYVSAGSLLGVLGSAQTNYLNTTNFGFSIPSTAIICGIKVDIERNADGLLIGSSIKDNSVYIIKGGVITGTNKASGSAWPASDGTMSYGSSTDLWGTTFTPAQINSPNFGVSLSADLKAGLASLFLTANVDRVAITVYYDNGVLPIEMVSLTATEEKGDIRIDWQTASELNSNYFSVEKMEQGSDWSTLAYVTAAGNSTTLHHYSAYDKAPSGMNYYRVKQFDAGSHVSVSQIIAISYSEARDNAIIIYPVPVVSDMHIEVKNDIQKVEIISATGQVLLQEIPLHQNDLTLQLSALPPGIYVLKVYTDYEALEKKFIKE